MKELHVEGVANHDDPESGVGVREGVGEALEQLRRIAFAMQGVDYPEGPTPKHERRLWPMERIG